MMPELKYAPFEFKFTEAAHGVFDGYASVYDTKDWHRDIVKPTAFDRTLAEYRSKGAMPTMYIQHEQANPFVTPKPAGIWRELTSDSKGLQVKGQLIALDTEFGKTNYALMRDGGLPGLSIAYSTPKDGAVFTKQGGEQIRELHHVDLHSIDIVAEPSNPEAIIHQLKAMMTMPNHQAAAQSLMAARDTCEMCMRGGDAPTADERKQITGHIADAYRHVMGEDMPAMKAKPETIRQFEDWLQEAANHFGFKYSNSEARAIAEGRAFKPSANPRDEDATTEAVRALRSAFTGFTLPKIGD